MPEPKARQIWPSINTAKENLSFRSFSSLKRTLDTNLEPDHSGDTQANSEQRRDFLIPIPPAALPSALDFRPPTPDFDGVSFSGDSITEVMSSFTPGDDKDGKTVDTGISRPNSFTGAGYFGDSDSDDKYEIGSRRSLASVRSSFDPNDPREVEILEGNRQIQRFKYLTRMKAKRNEDGTFDLEEDEQQRRLSDMARKYSEEKSFVFNRFSHMAILCLLHYQHQLMRLEEQISTQGGVFGSVNLQETRLLLLEYYEAIRSFSEVATIKRPGIDVSKRMGGFLAKNLNEPRYWDSPDALEFFDLAPEAPDESVDQIRKFLQNRLPRNFLDTAGKEQRTVQEKRATGPLKGGTARVVEAYKQQPFHISTITDNVARLLISTLGGIFLLAPMVALTFITSRDWQLVTTILFVLSFASSLAIATKASNHELLAGTAVYAAVLVVFVGNSISTNSK